MIRCNTATEAHQRYYLQKHSTKNDAALTYLKTTAENNYLASIDVIRYSDDTVFLPLLHPLPCFYHLMF